MRVWECGLMWTGESQLKRSGGAVGGGLGGGGELAAVVLGAAMDVIKGEGIVQSELVELSHREVVEEAPGLAPVAAFVDAAVAPVEDIVGIALDEGHGGVVAVVVLLVDLMERLAAVVRHH